MNTIQQRNNEFQAIAGRSLYSVNKVSSQTTLNNNQYDTILNLLKKIEQNVSSDSNTIPPSPSEEDGVIQQNLQFMIQQNTKQLSAKETDQQKREMDKKIALLLTALFSGNMELAMLIFSSLESQQAKNVTNILMKKLITAQGQRTEIAQKMSNLSDKDAKKQQPLLQAEMSDVSDQIQLLTSFIKDVADQKNRTVEFANNFNANEHQTTMNIVRGMRS